MRWLVRSQCICMKTRWWHREPRWKNKGNEWNKMSWERERIEGKKVNDQITKGKKLWPFTLKIIHESQKDFYSHFVDEKLSDFEDCDFYSSMLRDWGWILRKNCLLKEGLNIGRHSPWTWWNHHPWSRCDTLWHTSMHLMIFKDFFQS